MDVLSDIALEPASTVIGLVGPWGSGKSSTLNLALQQFELLPWTVVDINPWALPGPEYVIAEVIGAISEAVPRGHWLQSRVLRKRLARYARYALPLLQVIPYAGRQAADLGTAILNDIVAGGTQPERAGKLNDLLDKLKPRILVTIDDVDRLQPDELLALFRAIRVLGRLHHVHYLLSYDEQTVLDLLGQTSVGRGTGSGRALDFLEKIVTIRLDQPPTREEQAAELFDRQLQLLQEDLQIGLTEDQQSRLTLERETLFSGSLTEPRGIRRFFAQMHSYLPLIGNDEIDLVDFMVLSFVRTTWPKLYEELRLARRTLVRADSDLGRRWEELTRDKLLSLGVSERLGEAGKDALVRLFPLLSELGLSDDEAARRRVGRRVSDPDYVDRYFALTPPSDDVSDAALQAALEEVAGGRRSTEPEQVFKLLCPAGANREDWDRAARLYRRAAAMALRLQPHQAKGLLLNGLALVPAVLPPGIQPSVLAAAEAWISELLLIANQPSRDELTGALQTMQSRPSKLATLVSALRTAVAKAGAEQFAGLVKYSVELSWQRFIDNVRQSDSAPHERTSLLLSWVREHVPDEELRRRMRVELGSDLRIEDLAARLMLIGRGSSGHDTMLGLDRNSARVLLMIKEAESRIGELRAAESEQPAEIDEDDVSWPNLRKAALPKVLRELGYHGSFGQTQISPAVSIDLMGFRPANLPAASPGVTVNLNVLVPFGLARPNLGVIEDDTRLDTRESLLVGIVRGSALTTWAKRFADKLGAEWQDWQISGRGGRGFSVAVAGADVLSSDDGPPVRAIEVSAQLQPEPNDVPDRTPTVLLSVGIYIRTGEAARTSLDDFFAFLMALLQLSETARGMWSMTNPSRELPESLAQTIDVAVTVSVEELLELDNLFRIPGGSSAHLTQSIKIEIWPADTDPDPTEFRNYATKCLTAWLRDCGYRQGVDEAVSAAAENYRSLTPLVRGRDDL